MQMKKVVATVTAVAFAVAGKGGAYWYGTKSVDASGQATAATGGAPGQAAAKAGAAPGPVAGSVSVEAVKVATASLPQTITAVGSLRSDESVVLRPEVAGRISSISFQEGQRVAKGTLLVRLDTAVPQAEAQQARANMVLAKNKFDRAVDLAKSN